MQRHMLSDTCVQVLKSPTNVPGSTIPALKEINRLCLDREGDHRQTKMKPISSPIDPEEAQQTIHLKFMHGMDLAHAKWTVEMGVQ